MISVHYKLKIIEYKGKEHYTIGIFSETSDNIVGQICKLYSFVYRCLLAKKNVVRDWFVKVCKIIKIEGTCVF